MDLLTPCGFANAAYFTLNTILGGGALTAPVCSTFVVVWPSFKIRMVLGSPKNSRDSCSPGILVVFYPRPKKITGKFWKQFAAPLRSMGSTLRTRTNPLGRADSKAVRDGNLLCSRALLLMLLCSAKGIFWCLEQPSSSTMEWHPLFQMLLRLVTVRKLRFRMSQFGGPTPKQTILYSRISPRFSKVNFDDSSWWYTQGFSFGTFFKIFLNVLGFLCF